MTKQMKFVASGALFLCLLCFAPANAETLRCTEIRSVPTILDKGGIYCLNRNISTPVASGNIITIAVNNVTIDFNGFTLSSNVRAGTNATGVYAQEQKTITLRNGTVRGFYRGIHIAGSADTYGHRIEDMHLSRNFYTGISVQGTGVIVRNNRVANTGPTRNGVEAYGIVALGANGSVISGNMISTTRETSQACGILVGSTSALEIRGNSVLQTGSATSTNRGICLDSVASAAVIDNRVLNGSGTGAAGVLAYGTSSSNSCIGNTVTGFATALSGCNYVSGNHTP